MLKAPPETLTSSKVKLSLDSLRTIVTVAVSPTLSAVSDALNVVTDGLDVSSSLVAVTADAA
ncbi:hypothetical protein J8M21_25535, partial [Pseudoalteromonas luteoviolacea]|nr:hypothetical protein [Pseudoalteromonas luteoviolacea]MBQ4909607.1 hypothetical protein [Pseudoalteromonas luteoviolacea]